MFRQKFLTKTILLLSFVSLTTDVASEMLYPVMPVYLKSIGFSVLLIGILEGLAELTAGLSKGYFGQLSDTIGKRVPFVRWGYGLSAVSKPMMALFTFPLWIFGARTLDRLGKGIRTSARDAILSDESDPENKGKVFGFHRGMDTLGAAIGPAAALAFLYYYPEQYKLIFFIAFIPGLIAILLTFFLREKKAVLTEKIKVPFLAYFKYWKQSSGEYRKIVTGLLAFTLINSSDAFLLLMLNTAGYSDVELIAFYIFYNLCYALLSFPLGSLADKIGMKNVLILGFFVFAIVYFSIGWSGKNYWLTAIIFAFYAIYAASTEGVSKAWISNITPKTHTATALGFYNSLASVAAFLASSLGGLLWNIFNPQTMFTVSAAGALCVAFFFIFVPSQKKMA
ncbi:MAG TPA: MFS transporter [Bacteroidia bacterium]|nr:MFS transporter [Bacteroidia bacterium]HRS59960.1 MFS transporter [Bacteroidia bacterium]HRU69157.1 MFS transporter [Bacteroidia bacterium]